MSLYFKLALAPKTSCAPLQTGPSFTACMYGQLGCSANHRSNGQPPACVDWMDCDCVLVHLLHQPNHSTPPYVSLVFSPLSPGLLVRLSVCECVSFPAIYIHTYKGASHPSTNPSSRSNSSPAANVRVRRTNARSIELLKLQGHDTRLLFSSAAAS